LAELKLLLNKLSIRHLYVLVDDFSELPEQAMRLVVDALLAPLNNWSDEFIKFKIAAYPGRVYYGAIDKTKVDEVFLDLYRLYGTSDVSTMEDKAADFTRRLVERRLQHYAGVDLSPSLIAAAKTSGSKCSSLRWRTHESLVICCITCTRCSLFTISLLVYVLFGCSQKILRGKN
jgi:hypothetical protein